MKTNLEMAQDHFVPILRAAGISAKALSAEPGGVADVTIDNLFVYRWWINRDDPSHWEWNRIVYKVGEDPAQGVGIDQIAVFNDLMDGRNSVDHLFNYKDIDLSFENVPGFEDEMEREARALLPRMEAIRLWFTKNESDVRSMILAEYDKWRSTAMRVYRVEKLGAKIQRT